MSQEISSWVELSVQMKYKVIDEDDVVSYEYEEFEEFKESNKLKNLKIRAFRFGNIDLFKIPE